jgi:hypothetical protein
VTIAISHPPTHASLRLATDFDDQAADRATRLVARIARWSPRPLRQSPVRRWLAASSASRRHTEHSTNAAGRTLRRKNARAAASGIRRLCARPGRGGSGVSISPAA